MANDKKTTEGNRARINTVSLANTANPDIAFVPFNSLTDVPASPPKNCTQRDSDSTLAHCPDWYERAPIGYCTINSKRKIVQANPFTSALLGVPRNELSNQLIDPFLFKDDANIYFLLQAKLIETDEPQSGQLRVVSTCGLVTWVKIIITAEKREAGESLFHLSLIDISEHKKIEETLQTLQLASRVFTHTREGILVTDAEGNILDVNAAFTRITQYAREEVIGKNPRFLKSGHQNEAFYRTMWDSLTTKGYWHGEIWNRKKNGELYAELKSINAVFDENNNVINYISLFKDITERELHQTHLEHIAHFDALTGLPNRTLLIDRLHQGLTQAQRRKEKLAIVFIDLDGFKTVNDQYGHDAGDQLLIVLSQRMRHTLREGDTLSRLGGDEFVALLLDLPEIEDSLPTLSRLLHAASQPVQFDENTLQVSASLGVTFYPQIADINVTQLLRQADQAMYFAKLSGKNNYHIFNTRQDGQIHSQHENLSRIESAINNNEFELHYQPKVNMRTGKVIGVEASIFWTQTEIGQPSLSDKSDGFLSVIKNHSLNLVIGEWTLHSALTQIEHWQKEGFNMPVSVNISSFHLMQTNFVRRLSGILLQHPDVNPSYLELEIVESSAPEDLERVFQVIEDCRALGITCALDNFGSGFSSMTYLRRLPVSLLKIDLSFTRYMLENSDSLLVLKGAISLAHAFHLNIIAEGVNSIECGIMLMRLGCDFGQGSSIAQPMPAEALAKWEKNWKIDADWTNIPLANHEDIPLILASVENTGWCKTVENYILGLSKTNPLHELTQLQLGVWLNGAGLKQYGTNPVFSKLDELYHQSHTLAKQLCSDKECGNSMDEQSELNTLHTLSDELSKQINILLLSRLATLNSAKSVTT